MTKYNLSMKKIALGMGGVIPILLLLGSPADPGLLGFSLMVLAYFGRKRIKGAIEKVKIRHEIKYILLASITAVIVEFTSWLGTFWANDLVEGAPLFSLSLGTDLLLSFGLYLSLILSWVMILSIFKFSLKQVFMTMGLLGVYLEQQGQVVMEAVADPSGIAMIVYSFLVYAPLAALPFLIVGEEFMAKRDSWIKYPLLIIIMLVMILTVGAGWDWLGR